MAELTNALIIKLFDTLSAKKISVPKLSVATGIPKDRIYKWKQEGTNPKAEDEKIIDKWLKEIVLEKSPHGHEALQVDLAKELLIMKRKLVRAEATINILTVTMAEFISVSKKKSIATISAELSKAISSEEDVIFSDWGKK